MLFYNNFRAKVLKIIQITKKKMVFNITLTFAAFYTFLNSVAKIYNKIKTAKRFVLKYVNGIQFSLILLFIDMTKPSKITSIKAKKNIFLCPPYFGAITLMGIIYVRDKRLLERFNQTGGIDSSVESHEMIHVKQAVSTKDSWLMYYILYLWQWLCNLPLIIRGALMPYYFIAFELEAYINDVDWNYIVVNKDGCTMWKKLKKLTLSEKMKLAKEYKERGGTFGNFIRKAIDPSFL